ncbi:dyslexia-associated protein KIAA0319-like protein [Agrilus planipennis]|uniref:Dyslexia-associated protein KIAA0319-like protein n=1 Tax=Agrilus planipennis TaxID=224129 RepID=A0A1W4WUE5_AGRPL|nr:dyslexia-associated protein KIAA0319-like protein [Agrilus planipennis]
MVQLISAVLFIISIVQFTESSLYNYKSDYHDVCPHLYRTPFKGYVPRANLTAGTYTEIPKATSLKSCVLKCCVKENCNVVFVVNKKCYHIQCVSNDVCAPSPTNQDDMDDVTMVLVNPVNGDETWADIVEGGSYIGEPFDKEMLNILNNPTEFEKAYKEAMIQMDESNFNFASGCTIGNPEACEINEECIQNHPKSRSGTCRCKTGFARSPSGLCTLVLDFKDKGIHDVLNGFSEQILPVSSSTNTSLKQLTITVESKEVKLPENEVTLTAFIDPPATEKGGYQYDWNLIQQPEGNAAVKHQNGEQLQLSQLSEGLYTFKVTASNDVSYGEAFTNVTVLPPSRVNKPPVVVITPANQTVKLPNTGAVLDGSSSSDDDGITTWHWDLVQGPLGYEPELQETPTLQLKDLKIPGNYTFKLTITDTDKATNSNIANITVVKVTDYPPEANAGQNEILYLPHNSITLNGNLSSDDHAIVAWEWTKSASDANKAVDMQDTRTPYLKLSNLEEGMYTFVLKVTDSENQISTADVHVFVKPPTNKPPEARAGSNITISLPQTWVTLDASGSTDDNKIVGYQWKQVEGPNTAAIMGQNSSVTNVTGLTKGVYQFRVFVTDDNENVANDTVFVIVNQNENQKPKANAGGDFEVELPRNVIYINGSLSKDDWKVTKWKWTRDESSLAIGSIAEKSDETPVLMLTGAIPGKYVFTLTVYDEQGQTDMDTVTVTVKGDPMLYHMVDVTIGTNAKILTESQYNIAKGKLALLVQDGAVLKERGLKPESGTNRAILSFYVEDRHGKPLPASVVVEQLRKKLRVDESLLGFQVTRLQSVICQNNCSGHGVCDEQTRRCVCEAFWMQDLFNLYFGFEEDSDCRWSILYVVLGVICSVVALIGILWGAAYLCFSWCVRRRLNSKPNSYKLIEETDDLPPYSRKDNLTDSDTDSDVVFESRNKSSRFESRNGHKPTRNGFPKMGRRIKT